MAVTKKRRISMVVKAKMAFLKAGLSVVGG